MSSTLEQLLSQRILILDGAMGTMIQRRKLTEADFRGERFKNHPTELKGDNDLLSITRPDVIGDIHRQYLAAGADIIEANTFGANRIAQSDYHLSEYAREMNIAASRLARQCADEFSTSEKPRFVAGSIGPTNRTASISPDVSDPSKRNITFEELVSAYREAVEALVEGGVDCFLVETIFDTLNAKAALFAIESYFDEGGKKLPVLVSGTITDASGRTLSGQTVEAFWNSIRPFKPLAVGFNCALGAKLMRPYVQNLSEVVGSDACILCYPNAGLPNPMSETGYDETPDVTSSAVKDFADHGWLNIVGGCCGTTPEHIRAIAAVMRGEEPRRVTQ